MRSHFIEHLQAQALAHLHRHRKHRVDLVEGGEAEQRQACEAEVGVEHIRHVALHAYKNIACVTCFRARLFLFVFVWCAT